MLKTIETIIGHWVTLIKAHEKLLLTIIICLTLLHFGNKAYDAYGNHLKTVVSADNANIAKIEAQNAQTQAELAQLKATVDANAKIDDAKIAAAKKVVIVQQQVDAALPLPDLSKRWESLLALSPGNITPQPNGTVAVSTDAAHSTVNELEKVGPLQTQLSLTQDELKGCNTVRTKQDTQIAGLNTDVAAKDKKIADDDKQAKHDIRHAYLRGLKHGLIIGVPVGVALTVAAIIH